MLYQFNDFMNTIKPGVITRLHFECSALYSLTYTIFNFRHSGTLALRTVVGN